MIEQVPNVQFHFNQTGFKHKHANVHDQVWVLAMSYSYSAGLPNTNQTQ